MLCKDIDFGTYDCSYNIQLPWLAKFPWEDESERRPKFVAIDKCLLPEVLQLWELGIKTTGCCCGHGKQPPFIGVQDEYIDIMKKLGYQIAYNSCRPNDEDSFIPKTKINYGETKYLF